MPKKGNFSEIDIHYHLEYDYFVIIRQYLFNDP